MWYEDAKAELGLNHIEDRTYRAMQCTDALTSSAFRCCSANPKLLVCAGFLPQRVDRIEGIALHSD